MIGSHGTFGTFLPGQRRGPVSGNQASSRTVPHNDGTQSEYAGLPARPVRSPSRLAPPDRAGPDFPALPGPHPPLVQPRWETAGTIFRSTHLPRTGLIDQACPIRQASGEAQGMISCGGVRHFRSPAVEGTLPACSPREEGGIGPRARAFLPLTGAATEAIGPGPDCPDSGHQKANAMHETMTHDLRGRANPIML